MPQQPKLITVSLIGTVLVGLFIGVYLVAWSKRSSHKPDRRETVVKHTVETSHDDVLKYWTTERMRNAQPAPMPNVPNVTPLERGKKQPQRSPDTSDDPKHS